MATRTVANGGGNFSANATWVEGVAPTASDDVVCTGTSGNLTIDTTTCNCRSADFTGYTGTLTFTASKFLNIGTSSTGPSSLALKLIPSMNIVFGASSRIQFVSTTTGNQITWAGNSIGCSTIYSGVGGGWVFQDAHTGTVGITLNSGSLDLNGQTINVPLIQSTNSGVTRVLTLGAAAITLTQAGGTPWNLSGTALTFSGASSTITLSGAGVTFAGFGQTYGTVNFTGTGTDVITGANTFSTLSRSNTAAVTLTLPASATTTVTTLTINGTSGHLVSLISSSGGTAATLSVAAGTVRADYASIKDSTATGGATFIANWTCTDATGNTGWTFAASMAGAGTTAITSGVPDAAVGVAVAVTGTTAATFGVPDAAVGISIHVAGSTAATFGVPNAAITITVRVTGSTAATFGVPDTSALVDAFERADYVYGTTEYGDGTYGEGTLWDDRHFPLIYVEIAFFDNPGSDTQNFVDVSYTVRPDGTWGHRVRGLTTHRGKQHELDRMQAGTASIILDNRDRYLDPVYVSSPWYPYVIPDRRLRVWVNFGGGEYQVFQGLIDGYPQSYRYPHDGFVEIPVTDAFKMFANIKMKSVYEMEIAADSPKGWWRLGEAPPSSGSSDINISQATDSSGNGHHGTYSNDTVPEFSTTPSFGQNGAIVGDSNTAVDFRASFDDSGFALNSRIDWDQSVAFTGTGDFSVEMWFKDDPGFDFMQPHFPTGVYWWLSHSGSLTDNMDGTSTISRNLSFTASDAVALSLSASYDHDSVVQTDEVVDTFAGRWHHAVGVRSGTNAYLYLDGVLVASSTSGDNPNLQPSSIFLAGASNPTDDTDNVIADELAIYDTALSAARVLAHYQAGTGPWRGDTTGTRVGRVLDFVGWPDDDRDVDDGNTTLQEAFPSGAALDYLLLLMDTEYGELWMGPDGQVKFRERHAILQETPYTVSQATFGDAGPGSDELPYKDITPNFDDTQIRNNVRIQRVGGTVQEANDLTSQQRYFPRTFERTNLEMESDLDAWDQANWILQHYKEPALRVERIAVEPQRDPARLFPVVFSLEIGNRITVIRRPQGIGDPIEQDCLIEGITHTAEASTRHWRVEYQLSPVDTQEYALVGTAVVGTAMCGY